MDLAETPEFARKHLNHNMFLPSADVVVCTCQRPELLEHCLQAVHRLEYPVSTVVVVDNAPEGERAKVLAARFGARYVIAPVRGVSRARNAGARACTSDLVAYLDDDMVPHRRWLSALVAEFADARVMAVTGPVLPLDAARHGDAQLDECTSKRPWGPAAFQIDRASPQWFERANFGGIGDGNMAFRRTMFARWPGFEEQIGRGMPISGGEEHYAFFSIIDLGYRVAYAPGARVFHLDKEDSAEIRRRSITESAAYATFLAARHPRFAPKIARFFVEAAFGKKRSWHPARSSSMLARIPRLQAIASFAAGSLLYWRARGEPSRAKARQPEAEAIAGA